MITDWRGHRLYGPEPEPPNNPEDLRGHDSCITIAADLILGTDSEHEYGLSVWCRREDLSKGRLDNGQLLRLCAV